MKRQRVTYIDFYLVPVPWGNRAAYEELARIVVECWLDASGPTPSSYHSKQVIVASDEYRSFITAAGAGEGETVVMS
ncbi:MAG: hypothetical protein BWY63_01663 [Chloroflexi bacterium ADurb.Bin360]|nr:MAG: hypothetical protein BWY63_01663 [Chloroflexi bacterium ADurb.Bin360]